MDSIGKNSKVKLEYKGKVVRGIRYLQKSVTTDAVQPARPVYGGLSDPMPNQVFTAAVIQERADALKKAYRNLNDREQELKDQLDHYRQYPEEFLKLLIPLIKAFNQATASVLTFDRTFSTNHSEEIRNLLINYQFRLAPLGIHVVGINQLQVDEHALFRAIQEAPENLKALGYGSEDNLFADAYWLFSRITVPHGSIDKGPEAKGFGTSKRFDQKG